MEEVVGLEGGEGLGEIGGGGEEGEIMGKRLVGSMVEKRRRDRKKKGGKAGMRRRGRNEKEG